MAGGRGEVSFALMRHGIKSCVVDPRPVKLSKRQHTIIKQQQQQQEQISSCDPDQGEPALTNTVSSPLSDANQPAPLPLCLPMQYQEELHWSQANDTFTTLHTHGFDLQRRREFDYTDRVSACASQAWGPVVSSLIQMHISLLSTPLILGMHPDQATEHIIDVGLTLNTPAVVVPCCVFPSLFPRTVRRQAIADLQQGLLGRAGYVCEKNDSDMVDVVTYTQFLAYLLDKDHRLTIHYLPIEGRNRVIVFNPNK